MYIMTINIATIRYRLERHTVLLYLLLLLQVNDISKRHIQLHLLLQTAYISNATLPGGIAIIQFSLCTPNADARQNDFSEYPTDNAISRDAAESRGRVRSNGVGGDPCDKLIFIASWVAALSIGRRSGASHFVQRGPLQLYSRAAVIERRTICLVLRRAGSKTNERTDRNAAAEIGDCARPTADGDNATDIHATVHFAGTSDADLSRRSVSHA